MKQLLVKSILGFILVAGTASASTILCADQTNDATGVGGNTMDKYIALNSNASPGCMIGNLLFSDFAYSYSLGTNSFYPGTGPTGTGTQQNATSVTVGVDTINDKLSFNANWVVNHYQTATLSLSFTVSAPTSPFISRVQNAFTAAQGGTQNGGPIHNSSATCTGGTCGSPTIFTNQSVPIPLTPGPLTITNFTFMNANGSTNTSANNYHLSIISDQFEETAPPQTPEPMTIVLTGSALLGIGLLTRKRRQS
jgi:hypothetical protein